MARLFAFLVLVVSCLFALGHASIVVVHQVTGPVQENPSPTAVPSSDSGELNTSTRPTPTASTANAGTTNPPSTNTSAVGPTTTTMQNRPTSIASSGGAANPDGGNRDGNFSDPKSSSPSPSTVKGSSCFPGSAMVELESGARRRMDKIKIGDRVKVGLGEFSEVFMFTHKTHTWIYDFVKITTSSGHSVSLTGGHYIHVNGGLAAASLVAVGDMLQLGTGEATKVTAVTCVQSAGIYNPQTLHGDIVVDGIRASTYTTAVEPRLAHAGLGAFRSLYRIFGVTFSKFEQGADSLASFLPHGHLAL
jgi:Hint module